MKEYLEIFALSIGIAAPIIGGIWFLWIRRQSSIHKNYQTLAQSWTNEGDILGAETKFITLNLRLDNGDLFGTLESPQLDRFYDVHVFPGWFSSRLEISDLRGRIVEPKGTFRIHISDNRNRLQWKAIKLTDTDILPSRTVLWPL